MLIQFLKLIYYRIRFTNVRFGKKCVIGGLHTVFEGNNVVGDGSLFSGELGYGSYIGKNCNIEAKIGKYCSIGNNVQIILGKHPTAGFVSTHPAFFSTRKQAGFTYIHGAKYEEFSYADSNGHYVVIGNDVWIGQNASIMNGVTVGDGAIIASGAVVTKNVRPYEIVGGVPAKKIRDRFSEKQVKSLLEFKWWEKETQWISANADLFADIDSFLDAVNEGKIN